MCVDVCVCVCVDVCVDVCVYVCVVCVVYTCDAADEEESVDVGVWRVIIKKKG